MRRKDKSPIPPYILPSDRPVIRKAQDAARAKIGPKDWAQNMPGVEEAKIGMAALRLRAWDVHLILAALQFHLAVLEENDNEWLAHFTDAPLDSEFGFSALRVRRLIHIFMNGEKSGK